MLRRYSIFRALAIREYPLVFSTDPPLLVMAGKFPHELSFEGVQEGTQKLAIYLGSTLSHTSMMKSSYLPPDFGQHKFKPPVDNLCVR